MIILVYNMKKEDIVKLTESKISLKVDFIFKDIFSNNKRLLIDLLESILGYEIKSIDIIQDFALDKSKKSDKKGILDLKANLPSGEIVNIEMQIKNNYNTFPRMQFYASKLFAKEVKEGEHYTDTKPVICIAILDYLIHENQSHYLAKTKMNFIKKDNNGNTLVENEIKDFIQLITIELPIFRKMKHDVNNKLEQWLTVIEKNNISELEVVMNINENIEKALEELYELEATPEIEAEIEKLEDDLRNNNDNIRHATKQGIEIGLERGIKQGIERGIKQGIERGIERGIEQGIEQGSNRQKLKIIKSLINNGFNIEKISEITSMDQEEIKKILKKH